MTLFYIIRHGETEYNRNGRYQGQSDIPLNETGRAQSRALASRLAATPLDVIYASDLVRAQETARTIAGGRTVVLDPRLREVDVGRVVGLTREEIIQREPAFWSAYGREPDRTPFPGGESACDVQRRALEVFRAIRERYSEGRVAVVTHGGLIKMLVADVLGLSLAERHRVALDNCGLSVVEWGESFRRLRSLNDTGHLNQAPCELRTEF